MISQSVLVRPVGAVDADGLLLVEGEIEADVDGNGDGAAEVGEADVGRADVGITDVGRPGCATVGGSGAVPQPATARTSPAAHTKRAAIG
ncbi:hypothetical protein Q0Z83_051400 [Actinoplanes sichuanensis]|nr:hypothetical protein Q0Z83_051400 [Actinoplanes sichuanensis]